MGLWKKVRDAFGRAAADEPPRGGAARPDVRVTGSGLPPDELSLRFVLERLASPDATVRGAARSALAGAQFSAAVDALVRTDRARTAIELLHRAVALAPDEKRVAARLVELLCDRLEHAAAVPLLDSLLGDPVHGLRARFLRAEAAERAGDLDGARRHYELVLGEDLDYPKARARWERLRPERAVENNAPTAAGVETASARVGDRYRLRRELGRGTSGAVYLALDEELGREVALKLLHPHTSARVQAETRVRAWNEARIAAALRHPGVVAVYDLDEERGLLAMELCAGGTLRERLVRGRLPPAEAVRRARELFTTLEVVHRAGVLHRDLKPGNLLFREAAPLDGEEPSLVLGDFGLAEFERLADTVAAGTLPYLAPEARRGEPGPAADVYAGGVILFEMLAGALPFDRATALRGDGRWDGALPDAATAALAPEDAAALTALLGSLLAPGAAARPTPAAARAALDAIGAWPCT